MDARQLKEIVITPALTALGMFSTNAVNLLLGTAAQESNLGRYIVQQGIRFKGGIGIYQMEKLPYNDIWDRQIANNVALRAKIKLLLGYEGRPQPERMASDLLLATIMCRLYYYAVPKPLPETLPEMAAFWKKYYNTYGGKGLESEFIANYYKYIAQGLV